MVEQTQMNGFDQVYQQSAQTELYAAHAPNAFNWLYIEKPAFDRNLSDLYRGDIRVLDAGCGQGRTIEHLIKRGIKSQNIVGVDFSQELLTQAQQRLPEVNFIQADLAAIELPQATFDLVTCGMVMDCLDQEQLQATLANFYASLKKGGKLFYINAHPLRMVADDPSTYPHGGWRKTQAPWGVTIPFFYRTVGDFINTTIDAGFKITKVDEASIIEDAQGVNPDKYRHYKAHGVSRLAIKAIK